MAFKVKCLVRSKLITNEQPVEQFYFFGYDVSYNYENDIDTKLYKHHMVCLAIHRTLVTNTTKNTNEVPQTDGNTSLNI